MTFSIKCFCLSLGVAMILPACTKKGADGQREGAPAAAAGGEKRGAGRGGKGGEAAGRGPVAVRIDVAQKKVMPKTLESIVTLQGKAQAEVFSKVLGRVRSIKVTDGQAVRRGQTLAEIDRNDPGESYLSMPITSPFDGWVGRILATEGAQVSAQDAILTILDDTALRAEVFLPVADWALLSNTSKVSVRIGEENRPGRIVTISRAADAATGRGSFVVEVANKTRNAKSGTLATVHIEVEPKDRIVLSTSALSVTDVGSFLFVVEGDAAKRMPIEFELLSNDLFEVKKGLNGGENIVVEGSGRLFPGAKVKVVTREEDIKE